MTTGYDLVRITMDGGVTHSARQDTTDGWVFTACGRTTHRNLRRHRVYDNRSVLMGLAPNIDCMSCLVAEGRDHA